MGCLSEVEINKFLEKAEELILINFAYIFGSYARGGAK